MSFRPIPRAAVMAALVPLCHAGPGLCPDLPAPRALADGPALAPGLPFRPSPLATWQGVGTQVGSTFYDYQHNGSFGKSLALAADGTVHGVYTGGAGTGPARRVMSWCVDPGGAVTGPYEVTGEQNGFGTAAVTGPNPSNGLAPRSGVCGFHAPTISTRSFLGVEFASCGHAFNLLPEPVPTRYWPHIAVDGADRIHCVTFGSADPDLESVFYERSSTGSSWDMVQPLMVTNQSPTVSAIAVAANHDPKAAVVYLQRTGTNDIAYDGGNLGTGLHNDVRAFVSTTGDVASEILAANGHNYTNYGPGSGAPFGAIGCRAYADVDGVLDMGFSPALHLAFSAALAWHDSLFLDARDGSQALPVFEWNLGRGQIWHLDADTGVWGHVAGFNSAIEEEPAPESSLPQAFRMLTDRPQLAVDETTGWLYCIWSQYDPADRSALGYYNGEILARCSADNGATWGPAVNLTDTASPGCASGDCEAEDWASLAATVDNGQLHISFVHDRDAGGGIRAEGLVTENPVIHLRVPTQLVPPHAGTPWNEPGRVGLASHRRSLRWPCSAWAGPEAVLDSARWVEPVLLMNETAGPVVVDSICVIHHLDDPIGEPGHPGLRDLGLEVRVDGQWIPAVNWNRVLAPWTATLFRARVEYDALPTHDQLFVFHIQGRPSLAYRIAYDDLEGLGCAGVVALEPIEPAETDCRLLTCADSRPLEPANLVIQQGGGQVLLSWDPVEQSVAGCALSAVEYRVLARDALGSEWLVGLTPDTSLVLPGAVTPDTVRSYRVVAVTLP
jgi:hypothetical protein